MEIARDYSCIANPVSKIYRTPPLWVLVLLYGLAHFVSIELTELNWGNWGMFWLPSGVGVLMAVCHGWRGVVLGGLCSLGTSWGMYFLQNETWRWEVLLLQGLPVSLTDCFQYAVFFLVLGRAWPFRLDDRHNLFRVFAATLAAVLASVPLLIIVPRILLYLADAQQYPWPVLASLLAELELLLMSNSLGIMLVCPLGLVLMTRHLRQQMLNPGTLMLAGGILLALGLPLVTLMQEYLVLPFIAWMALRSKLGGVVLGMAVTGGGVAVLSLYGLGPFSDIPAEQAMTSLGAYILSLSLPLLVLGCVLAEWDEQNAQLEDTVRERTLALETANRDLFLLANRDFLTNAANRRHFLDEAGKCMQRAQRYDEPLSLGILDLDHFKRINDRYGHAVGDQVLVRVVASCQASLRASDLLGRWGGEEFVVLLPGIAEAEAVLAFEKLLHEVRELSIDVGSEHLQVSFSAGVAQWDGKESLEHLLSRADTALYEAKHEGRNQIRLALV